MYIKKCGTMYKYTYIIEIKNVVQCICICIIYLKVWVQKYAYYSILNYESLEIQVYSFNIITVPTIIL